jgi:hypothetical protein
MMINAKMKTETEFLNELREKMLMYTIPTGEIVNIIDKRITDLEYLREVYKEAYYQ